MVIFLGIAEVISGESQDNDLEKEIIQNIPFQSISTFSTKDFEHFKIGEDSYLAVASNPYLRGVSSQFVNSTIYKWNGESFIEFQQILTYGANDFEHFKIGSDNYLAVGNWIGASTQNVTSVIYKWDGVKFIEIQEIKSFSDVDLEVFEIGEDIYLTIVNSYNYETYGDGRPKQKLNSIIYKWDGETFVKFQTIITNSSYDFEHFKIGEDSYLAVANWDNGLKKANSVIYKWDDKKFVELEEIQNNGVYDLEYFEIGEYSYLAIANNHDFDLESVNVEIYKINKRTDDDSGKFKKELAEEMLKRANKMWRELEEKAEFYNKSLPDKKPFNEFIELGDQAFVEELYEDAKDFYEKAKDYADELKKEIEESVENEEREKNKDDEQNTITSPSLVMSEIDKNTSNSDNDCFQFGIRKNGKYCSKNYNFIEQLGDGESCDNNFECESNVCVSGECISEDLIKKILSWFRNFFG
jgi:hypothetical protein